MFSKLLTASLNLKELGGYYHKIDVNNIKMVRAAALLCPRLETVDFRADRNSDHLTASLTEFENLFINCFRKVRFV